MTGSPASDSGQADGTIACPGCGSMLARTGTSAPDRFDASGECWTAYAELSAYTLSLVDRAFPHQLAVDAYAAQHPGDRSKAISTVFALVGLYLACERDASGREVQRAHQALAQGRLEWPELPRPRLLGPITVSDVLSASPGAPRDAALRAWAAAVWAAWRDQQPRIRTLVAEWLPAKLAPVTRSPRD